MGYIMSVLLLSGGLDSLVLLASEIDKGEKPDCVSFEYGQRHRKELEAGGKIAEYYKVKRTIFTLPALALGGSALTDDSIDVPKGMHFADRGQSITVVPNRNLIMLSIAAAWAVQKQESIVLYAAHAGDSHVYPDCRPEFVQAASAVMKLACEIFVHAPFLTKNKTDIVMLGKRLRAPLELSWSCYQGGEFPCGECGACIERKEAGI